MAIPISYGPACPTLTDIAVAQALPHKVVKEEGLPAKLHIKTSYYTARVFKDHIVHLEVPGESEAMREARRSVYGGDQRGDELDANRNKFRRTGWEILDHFPNEVYEVLKEDCELNDNLPPIPPDPKIGYAIEGPDGTPNIYTKEMEGHLKALLMHRLFPCPKEAREKRAKYLERMRHPSFIDKYPYAAFTLVLLTLGLEAGLVYSIGRNIHWKFF